MLAIEVQDAARNVAESSSYPALQHHWAQQAHKAASQMVILTQDQLDNQGECKADSPQEA